MKKASLLIIGGFFILFFSGCSLNGSVNKKTNLMAQATFIKTTDGGLNWEPKVKIDDKKNISSLNVLSIAIDPFDQNKIYIGSEKNGIFFSQDGAETWSQIAFPQKVYGIALDPVVSGVIYASGVNNGRAKIYKKISDGEWKEIYTEPADGTVISSLLIDKRNQNVLYAGTSEGAIFKTIDAGTTWNNLYKANGPVVNIAIDSMDSNKVYFAVFQKNLLTTMDGGKTIEDKIENINDAISSRNVFSVISDPLISNTVYVGLAGGLIKSIDAGNSWTALNILESSKKFPIRAVAINPKNSQEIIYVSGKAIYKSIDGGKQWSTFQLDANKDVGRVIYNNNDSSIIYAGLRNF